MSETRANETPPIDIAYNHFFNLVQNHMPVVPEGNYAQRNRVKANANTLRERFREDT